MPPPKSKNELQLFMGSPSYGCSHHLLLRSVNHCGNWQHWRLSGHGTKCTRIYMIKPKKMIKNMHVWSFMMPSSGVNLEARLLQAKEGMNSELWWTTRQCDIVPNCIFQEKLIKCTVVVEPHQIGSPWHNTWSQNVSILLSCQGSMCDNRPQIIVGDNQ